LRVSLPINVCFNWAVWTIGRLNTAWVSFTWHLGDKLTLLIVFLTVVTSYMASWFMPASARLLVNSLIWGSLWFFYTPSFFWFFVSFEFLLFPTLFLILGWGYQVERLNAAQYFILYTQLFSLPCLWRILLYGLQVNSFLIWSPTRVTIGFVLGFLMFIAFLVKLPLYILHLWLPKAHVEAPTIGSVVLAGLLLKLGVAGLIRLINLFHLQPSQAFLLLGLGGAAIAGASIVFQRDLKALVAFASINHINFLLAALQTHTRFSQERRWWLALVHGIVASFLFSLAGGTRRKARTRTLYLVTGWGVIRSGVWWSVVLGLRANIGLPPTLNRISELLNISFLYQVSLSWGVLLVAIVLIVSYMSLFLLLHSREIKATNLQVWRITELRYLHQRWGLFLSPGLIRML